MEINQNCHDVVETQIPRPIATSQFTAKQRVVPHRFKLSAEITD